MRRLVLAPSVVFLLAVVVLAGKNPADYPLQIQIVESHWHRQNGALNGWGRGNIKEGESVRGFDFTYQSQESFLRTIGNARYLAKWKKEPFKLEMLVGEIGATEKYHTYDLKTSVRDEIYVTGPNGTLAVSKEEYKAKWAK